LGLADSSAVPPGRTSLFLLFQALRARLLSLRSLWDNSVRTQRAARFYLSAYGAEAR
jgi:hypothetical protein